MKETYSSGFKRHLVKEEYQTIIKALLEHPDGITRSELAEELKVPSKSLESIFSKLKIYGIIDAVPQYSPKTRYPKNTYYIKECYVEQLRQDLKAETAK